SSLEPKNVSTSRKLLTQRECSTPAVCSNLASGIHASVGWRSSERRVPSEATPLEQRVGEPGRPCLPWKQEIGGSNPFTLTTTLEEKQERAMSDIKIYGEHEPKTLAQMQRCMTVGSAVKGVLCADGHLGYAHPIGGVVAYEEDISISGVGFDIACGNMAVRLDAS